MSYAKKTLSDLKQSLADKIASGTVPTSSTTLSYWTRMLNQGVAYCSDRLRLTKSTSLTTASGTIALPDDFLLINRVVNAEGTEVAQISMDQSVGVAGLVFWIKGNHTDGFTLNMPTENDGTYTVWYTYRPSEMSTDSDVCVIPDPMAVVCYAYSKLRMAQTDPLEDADKEMADCNRRLDEIIDAYQLNDQPLGFQIDAVTTSNNWFQQL